jgi:hypothetical protein
MFVAHLLARNIRVEEDLVDQRKEGCSAFGATLRRAAPGEATGAIPLVADAWQHKGKSAGEAFARRRGRRGRSDFVVSAPARSTPDCQRDDFICAESSRGVTMRASGLHVALQNSPLSG